MLAVILRIACGLLLVVASSATGHRAERDPDFRANTWRRNRANYLALEMIDQRCPTQLAKYMREYHVNAEGVGLENAERGVQTPGLAHEAAHEEMVKKNELHQQHLEDARKRDPALNTPPPPAQLRKSRRHLSMVEYEVMPGDEPPITPWESRTTACVEAAKIVQLYCVGAAEDKGMAEAAPYLEALHCTNVLRG
uniref:Uncharacterized protein n=1 Tax=Pyramimonas obovata TaxID=1411642 RepID=A0A7S0R6K7_9CHLO|mmetsp:Transcript_26909/g.58710  ORF Transcript_26909/g.58710 Transcript_26909/m.58710 type:complete len:195 (+) Transcript_26909:213-797(+)|eukprot:CAMPEP_0118952250 /NCGR_PEP_ID=MMETSP1169-20130426/54535_1 /TAXON_ID=36882 /ORGANISM="Pyramimonas obovata, Strain CCMP722" /LENGTH=194 /DNA_ID=CAMNT_0006899455 /DNA_START=158 /DNA_END=742 /DNA_ORIENTATION=-